MNTFDVALRNGTLPENPLELVKMKYFGESALKFLRANLANANELEIPIEQRKTMLAEGQKIGICLLDAEAKIGELSTKIPQEKGNRYRAPIKEGSSRSKYEKGLAGQAKTTKPPKHQKLGLKNHLRPSVGGSR